MAKLQFDDLSSDIKLLIVDRVSRPNDLKNLCLVNRELHEIAVQPLYRNVSFDLGSPYDTRLSAFLNPKNKGLKHIRQIRLYLANVRDRCNSKQQAIFATRMLLEFLPEDVLEEFRWDNAWCPWEPFSADNLLLLYKKQRKMKWLEVMDLDRNVLPDLKRNPKITASMFSHAQKLALYPENRETLDLCHFFVERTMEALAELIIHAGFDSHDMRDHSSEAGTTLIDARELNDSATAPGLISRTIFSHMMPFEKCTPFPELKSLRLHRISLRYCEDTWCKFVDFTRLEYLRLYQCPGADSLFGQLSKAANLPKQLKCLEFQHKDNSENEALMALDGFLCLVSGVRDVVIDMDHVKAMPAAAAIARHGKTLELLNVHCSQENTLSASEGEGEELVWEADDFEKICKACTQLEQLSCAWPQTSLIRAPSDEWKAYESAFASNCNGLVTLHVSTWPDNKPSTHLLPRSVYEQLLPGLAQRIFELAAGSLVKRETSPSDEEATGDAVASSNDTDAQSVSDVEAPSSKLRLIAFGISDKIYEREDSRNQMIYLRSTALDCLGKEQIHATPIGWCLRQFVEPRSEVLDFVLHKGSGLPCRERDVPWGADEDEFEIA